MRGTHPSFARLALAACLLAAAGSAPSAAPAGVPVGTATDRYTELVTADFTLIMPAGESRARARASQVASFRQAASVLLGVPLASPMPTTIFAMDGPAWRLYAEPRPGVAGYFVRHPFAADLMFDASTRGRQPLELLLHEYTHHLLRTIEPVRVPPFFDEGLAEVLGTATFGSRSLRLGLRTDHLERLRQAQWMPFERLVEVKRRDAQYVDHGQARLFYAQAWATIFYALATDSPARPRLPAFLAALRAGEASLVAAERLLGRPAAEVNDAVRRFVLSREPPPVLQVRLPRAADAPLGTARRLDAAEYGLRLGELVLRAGQRPGLAAELFAAVPADGPFGPRARVGAALARLQEGDAELAAATLDDPAIDARLDPATGVQLARGLLRLALPGSDLATDAEPVRVRRLARARALFEVALPEACCALEATHGYVLATLALQRPDPGLLSRALVAYAAAPGSSELAVAVALVHELEGRAAEARSYWSAAAGSLQQGPARSRMLERLRRDAQRRGGAADDDDAPGTAGAATETER